MDARCERLHGTVEAGAGHLSGKFISIVSARKKEMAGDSLQPNTKGEKQQCLSDVPQNVR